MIYDDNGYLNYDYIISRGATYNFIVGGRGTGKTFGALKWVIDSGNKFIFMRRTQTQVDMIKNEDLNPFNALETVLGPRYSFQVKSVNKSVSGIYPLEYNAEKQLKEPQSEPIGYIMALSTISNLRGFDVSTEKGLTIIYDEFIPEKHEKAMRSEGTAFLNAIETIARNRELIGLPPVKVLALANSNDLVNPIFIELKIVNIVERMIKTAGDQLGVYRVLPERDLAIFLLNKSPISEAKAKTSLYRLAGKSEFTDMAINNEFINENRAFIRSCNIKEYKPVVTVGELTVYVHKSQNNYYVTSYRTGSPPVYDAGPMDLKRFTRDYYFLWLAYMNKFILFESYLNQVLFERYFKLI